MFHSAKTTKKFHRKSKLSNSKKMEIVQATLTCLPLHHTMRLACFSASCKVSRPNGICKSAVCFLSRYLHFSFLKPMIDRESSFYLQAGPYSQVLSELWMQIPAKHLSPDLQQLDSTSTHNLPIVPNWKGRIWRWKFK